MHVAIVGKGALGRVYGVRIANRGGASVTFVVRPPGAPSSEPVRITRIDGDGAREAITAPSLDVRIPDHADVVLVAVRVEQLDDRLDALLDGSKEVPVVVLTPMLPKDLDRLTQRHGPRLRAGMPGVVAYMKSDGRPSAQCRYWLPKVAPTLLDAAPPVPPAVTELVQALVAAGFGGHLELGVHESNPATTLSFIPLAMGVDAAGGVDPLLADRLLLRTALDAVQEGLVLARRVGKTPAWLDLITRFAGPTTLKLGIGFVRSRSPETLTYIDEHFGRKLHAQNLVMAREIVELAREKGTSATALGDLLGRLEKGAPG